MPSKPLHRNDIHAIKAIARINAYNLRQMAAEDVLIPATARHAAENIEELIQAVNQLEAELYGNPTDPTINAALEA